MKKKRGRPPKQQDKERTAQQEEEDEAEAAKKAKRALNRFNGMSVAEVMAKTLPDVITYNLDILIVSYSVQTDPQFSVSHTAVILQSVAMVTAFPSLLRLE